MSRAIMLYNTVEVQIPNFSGELHPYTIVWVKPIVEDFYEASLRSKDNGFTLWLIKIENSTVIPISCILYLDSKEATTVKLADSLKMQPQAIRDILLKERIDVWRKNQIQ